MLNTLGLLYPHNLVKHQLSSCNSRKLVPACSYLTEWTGPSLGTLILKMMLLIIIAVHCCWYGDDNDNDKDDHDHHYDNDDDHDDDHDDDCSLLVRRSVPDDQAEQETDSAGYKIGHPPAPSLFFTFTFSLKYILLQRRKK